MAYHHHRSARGKTAAQIAEQKRKLAEAQARIRAQREAQDEVALGERLKRKPNESAAQFLARQKAKAEKLAKSESIFARIARWFTRE